MDDRTELIDVDQPSDDQTDNEQEKGVENEQQRGKKRIRKTTSVVWQYFEKLPKKKNEEQRARCKDCGITYASKSKYGTGNMKRHIAVCPRRCTRDVGQMLLLQGQNGGKFDHDKCRELLTAAVILHDLPFQFVEWSGIRNLLLYLRPDLHIVTRNTCKDDCLKMHEREKVKMRSMLLATSGRICLTSDCWTSLTTDGYICLTAHFIDENWIMQKRIINFCFMPPPHTGIALSEKICAFITNWGLEKKIFSLTLDNASVNDVSVDTLRTDLVLKDGLLLDGRYFHIRCCAHVLNLIVQDGLKDVPTRWNSTYIMLENALYYRLAFTKMASIDMNYLQCPSSEEWNKVEKIRDFLSHFYHFTLEVSGSKYPTANMFFPGVFTIYVAIKQANDGGCEYLRGVANRMLEKFMKYWSKFSEILAVAVVLDPRYKLNFVEYCFEKVFENGGTEELKELEKNLFLLFNEYVKMGAAEASASSSSAEATASSSSTFGAKSDLLKEFRSTRIETSFNKRSQLEQYLEEPIYPSEELDVLDYWKTAANRFPEVAALARDVLSIPISTVASESAFSLGGKVLDKYRSSLKSEVVEALVCTKDWLFGSKDILSIASKKANNMARDDMEEKQEIQPNLTSDHNNSPNDEDNPPPNEDSEFDILFDG